MSECGAVVEANELLSALIAGTDFTIPPVDLAASEYSLPPVGSLGDAIAKLTNADLTTGTVSGTGTFDILMRGFNAHLKEEYEKGRITGEQYSKAYIELTVGAMSNAVQYLLGRDQAYWQAVVAQQQAQAAQAAVVTARVQLATAKVQLQALRAESLTQQAGYALTKLKLATEDVNYCAAKYQYAQMLPIQKDMLKEQYESQRAQTLDTRSDLTPVTGQIGKQKALYEQQITSYKRDAENKTAKLFTDAWITMKTIDEGLLPPNGFINTSLDEILTKLKQNNELTGAP